MSVARAAAPRVLRAPAWALLAALAVAAPRAAAERPPAAENGPPRVAVEPADFDFGRTLPERVLKKTFRVRNFGGSELVIGKIEWDCDCAVAQLSEDSRHVAPGASVDLHVTLYTRRALGRVSRRVIVSTNDPDSEHVEITLKADVVAPPPRAAPRE